MHLQLLSQLAVAAAAAAAAVKYPKRYSKAELSPGNIMLTSASNYAIANPL